MTDIITQLRREGDMPVPNVLVIREAADEFARMARRYSEEHFTVCRVWKALGIDTYEQANGKAIDELVADLRAEIESLRRENAWLPIESAPRQGRILVYNGFFGAYTIGFTDGQWPIFLSDGMRGNWYPVPSHWRPLPSLPIIAGEG